MSNEFRTGTSKDFRARLLGDVGRNAPEHWEWGGPGSEPHLLVMFFAEPEHFDSFVQSTKGNTWSDAFEEVIWLAPAISTEMNHLVSPMALASLRLTGTSSGKRHALSWNTPTLSRWVSSCSAIAMNTENLPIGLYWTRTRRTRNYCPLWMRRRKKIWGAMGPILSCDNWNRTSESFGSSSMSKPVESLEEADQLGAKMVGRTRAGDPLVPIQAESIPGTEPRTAKQNQFTYEADSAGARCPFGAHIRRANPRNSDFPERRIGALRKLIIMLGFGPKGFYDDLTSSVRFHRILRRGREYGSELSPEQTLQPPPAEESPRGLHFICLNANIARQFEFLQNAWIASTKFAGLTGESDPLLGNREPIPGCPVTGNFKMPGDGTLPRRVSGLPQFVMVRGGAYFFLPSLRALRYFARA